MLVVLYIIVGIIALLLVLSFVMPSKYMVEKSTIIKATAATVINYVGDLNKYASWNPWQQMDPTAKATITGTPKTPGHKYAWVGKKTGEGSLTVNSIDDEHVHIDLEFIKPWKAKAKDNWHFEPWGDGSETKVTWQNGGDLPWPMGRLMYPVINKNLNHQFDVGLGNLKKVCEG